MDMERSKINRCVIAIAALSLGSIGLCLPTVFDSSTATARQVGVDAPSGNRNGQSRSGKKPHRPTPPSEVAKLTIKCDLKCWITIDGEHNLFLAENASSEVALKHGQHTIKAGSGSYIWERVVLVEKRRPSTVLIELKKEKAKAEEAAKVGAERKKPEADETGKRLAENTQGEIRGKSNEEPVDRPPTTLPRDKASRVAPGGLLLRQYWFDFVTVNSSGSVTKHQMRQTQYYLEELSGVSLEMTEIPGGEFMMGSPAEEANRIANEGPQHTVTVSGFYMGKYEITQEQWLAVVRMPKVNRDLDANPSAFKGDHLPVEQVSWNDALEFCERLSRATGRKYRLPTEAEWEYACRAGTTSPFAFGETVTAELVNYDGNFPYGSAPKGPYRGQTRPVGFIGVGNGFGLSDMHGNVWEWCMDYWHERYNGAPTDGSAWQTTGEPQYRVLRGGSWDQIGGNCRAAVRGRGFVDGRKGSIGFRLVTDGRPHLSEEQNSDASLSATASVARTAVSYADQGDYLAKQGNWTDAEAAYRMAVKMDSKNPFWHADLALALLLQGKLSALTFRDEYFDEVNTLIRDNRWPELEVRYRERIRSEPDSPLNHIRLSHALLKLRKYSDAEAEADTAISLAPTTCAWQLLKALTLLWGNGGISVAESQARATIMCNPEIAASHSILAWILRAEKRWEEAESEYREAVSMEPRDAVRYFYVSLLLLDRKKDVEAERWLKQALALAPGSELYHFYLGLCLEAQHRWREAEAEVREAMRIRNTFSYHMHLCVGLADEGKYSEAITECKEALRDSPSSSMVEGVYKQKLAQVEADAIESQMRVTKLPAPHQARPLENEVFDYYPRTTKLEWKTVDGAASYRVEVDVCDGSMRDRMDCINPSPWLFISGAEPTCSFSFVGANPGRWRVWAIDKNGRGGLKSPWRSFIYLR
jgi:formylglycine-generating enzyme required for sulfatase activity/tetratricopeptide (TPR) repeat protein